MVDNDPASPSRHDVYVVDSSNHRLTKFTPDGEFLYMAGKGVDQGGGTPGHPGDICTAEYLANGDTCGSGERGTGAGEFFDFPTSVAVGPDGHVWVGDRGRLIELGSEGEFISEAPVPESGGAVRGLAVDPSSSVFYLKSASLAGIRRYELSGSPPLKALTPLRPPSTKRATLHRRLRRRDLCRRKHRPLPFHGLQPRRRTVSQFGAGQVISANPKSTRSRSTKVPATPAPARSALYVA